MIILGIDPGIAIVGWGVISYQGGRFQTLAYGAIETKAGLDVEVRLEKVYRELCEITYPAAVKTDYGHHIMFYLGDSWYREIKNTLSDADYEEYCDNLLKQYEPSIEIDHKDWKYIAG